MCLGLTVTYLTTKVPNFAAGDFVVTGTYATATAFILWHLNNPYLATPLGFLFGGLAAVAMYLTVLRPLIRRGSSLVMLMIATLAVDLVFIGAYLLFIENLESWYGRIISDRGFSNFYTLYALGDNHLFGYQQMLFAGPVIVVGLTGGLYLLLNKTKFGVAMRASIENPNLAKTVGINVERVYMVSWFLAGGIAGLAGGLFSIVYTTPQNEATLLIVSIFAGSVLGGLNSIYGAIIGGFVIGVGEVFIPGRLALYFFNLGNVNLATEVNEFTLGIPLAAMIIILLVAPQGLTGVNWGRLVRRLKS
jgi:branched-chain amino acid transport system permease protein